MAETNIPGIHNYCDRWCEKCAFSKRCAVFAEHQNDQQYESDVKSKLFWDKLSENFTKAKSKLEQIADQAGIDLTVLTEEIEKSEKKRDDIRRNAREHPIATLSMQYSEASRAWLQTQPGMLDKLEHLKEQLTLGLESREEAKIQTQTIRDSLAVINWYSSFIHTKLVRALTEKFQYDDVDQKGTQPDYDGNAKVALIGIERSLKAWESVFEILPQQEDDFLTTLAMLDKLRGLTLQEFPDAMKFVRPGFDDPSAQ